jgi:hypothetical protein
MVYLNFSHPSLGDGIESKEAPKDFTTCYGSLLKAHPEILTGLSVSSREYLERSKDCQAAG